MSEDMNNVSKVSFCSNELLSSHRLLPPLPLPLLQGIATVGWMEACGKENKNARG